MLKPQTHLNALKNALNAALFGARPPASGPEHAGHEADGAKPGIAAADVQALSGLGHFRIPLLEPPGEGWVYVGDGEMKRADKLTDYERQREALLVPIARRAIELYLALARLKADWNKAFDEIELLNAPKNTARVQKGKKPSLTLYLLDRSVALMRQRSDCVRYEEDIMLKAKLLVDECIEQWSEDAQSEMRQIANLAFAKNRNGQYSRAQLLTLRKVTSDNPRWKEAMDIIKDAELPDGVASYLVAQVRDGQGKYHPLPLDMASVREWVGGDDAIPPDTIKPIRCEADYRAVSAEINLLLNPCPPKGTPEYDRLDVLTELAWAWTHHVGSTEG